MEPRRLFDLPAQPEMSSGASDRPAHDGTRSSSKPSSPQRRAPFFAAGWDGDPATPVACRDCGLDCYVGASASDPARAEIAHIDPSDQRWFSVKDGWSNVTVCCRSCNHDQGNSDLRWFGVEALVVTREHVAASVEEAEARKVASDGQEQRRVAARAVARAARRGCHSVSLIAAAGA